MNDETTDLEYREAALRLAIQSYEAAMERPIPPTLVARAKFFEVYLRTGKMTE